MRELTAKPYRRAELVKDKVTPPTIPHLEPGEPEPHALEFEKPKAKGNGETPYFFKGYTREINPQQAFAKIEAIVAHFSRLIFSPKFTPKVRVVAKNLEASRPQIISKTIPGFKAACELSRAELGKIIETEKRGLTQLLVKLLIFEDPDLHGSNWGVDCNNNVINFDHDRSLGHLSKNFLAQETILGAETSADSLTQFPNLLYDADDFFGTMSIYDILYMPTFHDIKPYNHPFKFKTVEASMKETWELFSGLSTNLEVTKWAFFYFTKYFLLFTPEMIKIVIEAHSLPSDSDEDIQMFYDAFINKLSDMKARLFSTPGYAAFLKDEFPNLLSECEKEIAEYNLEFCDKNTGEIKREKEEFIIKWQTVLGEDRFEKLKIECETAVKNDTPEKIEQDDINLNIARIRRDASAIKTLYEAIQKETERQDGIKKCGDSFKGRNLHAGEKHFIRARLDSNEDLKKFHCIFFNKTPNATYADFFLSFSDKVCHENLKMFHEWEDQLYKCIFKIVISLFKKYTGQLTTLQLFAMWKAYETLPPRAQAGLIVAMMDFKQFEKMPAAIFDWATHNFDMLKRERGNENFIQTPLFQLIEL